jgi:hypothetical protein
MIDKNGRRKHVLLCRPHLSSWWHADCTPTAFEQQSDRTFGLQFYCSHVNCIQTASELLLAVGLQLKCGPSVSLSGVGTTCFLLPFFSIRHLHPFRSLNKSILMVQFIQLRNTHRLSINRPTKRGERSLHLMDTQCEKEMVDYFFACQQIFEIEPHSDTPC